MTWEDLLNIQIINELSDLIVFTEFAATATATATTTTTTARAYKHSKHLLCLIFY